MIIQPWVRVGMESIGLKEYPGSKNNPTIMAWAAMSPGWAKSYYTADSIPWCGLFVGYCMMEVGIRPRDGFLSSLDWLKFGKRLNEPAFGCIMIFKREGGGHVGFAVGQDKDTYHILGGNQSDSVSITRVSKSRFVGCVWPPDMDNFYVKGLPYKQFDGKISTNEA